MTLGTFHALASKDSHGVGEVIEGHALITDEISYRSITLAPSTPLRT